MKNIGSIRAFIIVLLIGLTSSIYAKDDVEVKDILFGSYS